MRKFNRKTKERGAILVEFALVVPLLLLLLMGTIEIGLLFYNQQVLTNASREGARAGIAHSTASEIAAIVENYCQGRLIRFNTDVDPATTVTGALGAFGNDLKVNVDYDYTFLVPEMLGFGPNLQLHAVTTMKMEIPLPP